MNAIASLSLSCLGIPIRLRCSSPVVLRLLRENFGAMHHPGTHYVLDYEIIGPDSHSGGHIVRPGLGGPIPFADDGELISALEGDLVIQLQLLQPRYLFVHAAVLHRDGEVILLVGRSGAGKSTTCWGLLHHGFHYFSDELAPIDLASSTVRPYAHALCMKAEPPREYPLPEVTQTTTRGFHVPVAALPWEPGDEPLPISRIFFVEHDASLAGSSVSRISSAEATARLYPNVLNALAHANRGSDAALRIAKSADCYLSMSASLSDTCRLIADQ